MVKTVLLWSLKGMAYACAARLETARFGYRVKRQFLSGCLKLEGFRVCPSEDLDEYPEVEAGLVRTVSME